MAEQMNVTTLLGEFGTAILDAQNTLISRAAERVAKSDLRTLVSIGESEIEVKMLFEEASGATAVKPVSAGKSRLADLPSGAFSTLRARFVTVPDETPRPPVRKPSDIRDEVLGRPDLSRLRKIFGELEVRTTYVSAAERWIVDVAEPGGQILRSLQVPDVMAK